MMAVMRGLTIGIVSLWLALCLGCVASAPQVPVSKAEGPMSGLKVRIESGSATANDDHAAGWYQAFLRSFRQAALKAGLRVVDGEDYAVRVVVHGDKVESGILQAPPQKNPTTGQVTQAAPVGPRYLTESSVVRAQLFARGTNELIDEVTFRIGETIDGNVELDGSDGFVAAELINRVLGSERMTTYAASSDGGTKDGSPSPVETDGPSEYAQGDPQRNAFALVVGIETYRDVEAKASGAEADAEMFKKVVEKTLGVPEENVRYAVGDRATKVDIEKHIDWLLGNVPEGGRIFFYFSGHGAPDPSKGTPYLLPYDGDPSFLDRTALELDDVLARLSSGKAEDAVAFIDTCFSGSGGRSVLPKGARPLVRVKKVATVSHVSLFSAASGDQISGPSEDGNHGVFTRYLGEGLGQGKADTDGDGNVTLSELSEWVGPRVAREAKRQNREQQPSLAVGAGATAGEVVVARGVGK